MLARTYRFHSPRLSARHFSSGVPTCLSKSEEDDTSSGVFESMKHRFIDTVVTPKNQFYALVAGGSLGAFIISKGLLSFTGFFTHLSPITVAKYGFYTGFGTASVLGGMSLVTADNLYIRADPVYKYCKNWATKDIRIQNALGNGLHGGELRSYRLDPGNFKLKGKSLTWRPPRIQMIFDIKASDPPYRTGLVTCEATKSAGFPPRLKTDLLKVDYETGNEHEGGTEEGDKTIFLVGSEEDMARVSSRSGLSLEKLAQHVRINRGAHRK